ncbi:CASP-like protein 4B1 [Raphanus sativus]|uniref:CASP-like protein n=1 Tax=Raphanus sativus TaxID=3726 RepID=A0A6J0MV46_RAPSA|nr:CASP-like protein 4B1 [Raphanus sativus]KAJ4906878.1 CASP-like protein 4B1 [Raphanus sativus]
MTTSPDNQKPVEPSDIEAPAAPATETSTFSAITQRWKREDMIKKASPISRGIALIFSLLAFLIMVCNKHGPGRNFDEYEEYRYVVAIAITATLYTAWQTFVHLSKRDFFDRRTSIFVDFSGDQIVAYLLISAASSAIPLTNRFREGQDNIFTDSAASAITMAVLAFVSLALSALFSGYKLSTTHSFV